MSDDLLVKAQRLAERPYQTEIECEPGVLSPQIPRFTASIKELPYCVAQGFTEEEARKEIRSVLVDYILSLLARDAHVPDPVNKFGDFESDYTSHWLLQDYFVHAKKSVLEKVTSPKDPIRTIIYSHSI